MWEVLVLFELSDLEALVTVKPIAWQAFVYGLAQKSFLYAQPWSWIPSDWKPSILFVLFFQSTNLRKLSIYKKKANTVGRVTSFIVWYLKCHRKRASKQTYSLPQIQSLFVYLKNRPIMQAENTLGLAYKRSLAILKTFSGPWGDHNEDQISWISSSRFCHFIPYIHFGASPGPTSVCTN